jgi:hypothetical protein
MRTGEIWDPDPGGITCGRNREEILVPNGKGSSFPQA